MVAMGIISWGGLLLGCWPPPPGPSFKELLGETFVEDLKKINGKNQFFSPQEMGKIQAHLFSTSPEVGPLEDPLPLFDGHWVGPDGAPRVITSPRPGHQHLHRLGAFYRPLQERWGYPLGGPSILWVSVQHRPLAVELSLSIEESLSARAFRSRGANIDYLPKRKKINKVSFYRRKFRRFPSPL